MIFTVRSDALSRHPGEISFPGGLLDEGESPADAARREAFEEIGLDPASTAAGRCAPGGAHVCLRDLRGPVRRPAESAAGRSPRGRDQGDASAFRSHGSRRSSNRWSCQRGGSASGMVCVPARTGTRSGAPRASSSIPSSRCQGGGSLGAESAPEARELRSLLGEVRVVAVVGMSSKPSRPSHDVASYLQEHGYRIVPVNPNETEVLGEQAYPTPSATSHGSPRRRCGRVPACGAHAGDRAGGRRDRGSRALAPGGDRERGGVPDRRRGGPRGHHGGLHPDTSASD